MSGYGRRWRCYVAGWVAGISFYFLLLPGLAEAATYQVWINIPARILTVYNDGMPFKQYPVAVGKPSTPTPVGDYKIILKEKNPWWYPIPDSRDAGKKTPAPVPPGPDNPLGYRWMEFRPLYGIHGTNAPWSIGRVVSNGCIRMLEQDVEELYELLAVGTPVRISYDRLVLQTEPDGGVTLSIYPDCYGQKNLSVFDVRQKISETGIDFFVDENAVQKLLASGEERKFLLAGGVGFECNGQVLKEKGFVCSDAFYMPAAGMARVIGQNYQWNPARQTVDFLPYSFSGKKIGSELYVEVGAAWRILGGNGRWNEEKQLWEGNLPRVLVNGMNVMVSMQKGEGTPMLSLLQLGQALKRNVEWEQGKSRAWVDGKMVSCVLIQNEPYIYSTQVLEVFQALLFWDPDTQQIDITYPAGWEG